MNYQDKNAKRWASYSEEERDVRVLLAGLVHGTKDAKLMATRKYADRDLHVTALYNTGCYGFSIAHDGMIPHGFLVVTWAMGRVLDVVLVFRSKTRCLTKVRHDCPDPKGAPAVGVIERYLRRLGVPGEAAFEGK